MVSEHGRACSASGDTETNSTQRSHLLAPESIQELPFDSLLASMQAKKLRFDLRGTFGTDKSMHRILHCGKFLPGEVGSATCLFLDI
jgi:hypothetical protein